MCFVCGINNSIGLNGSFYETDANEVIGCFMPSNKHQGYPDRLHGGVASAILDEMMFRAILAGKDNPVWGVTIDLFIKYRKAVSLNKEIKAISRITNENSRMFEASAELYSADGELAVTATGKYLKMSGSKLSGNLLNDIGWEVCSNDKEPESIEIKNYPGKIKE